MSDEGDRDGRRKDVRKPSARRGDDRRRDDGDGRALGRARKMGERATVRMEAREDEGLTTRAVSGTTQYVASARDTWAGRRWR